MSNRITIFTTCKPFEGEAAVLQHKALETWSRLEPSCEVLILGDESGAHECCQSLGLRHHPDVKRNEWGTPLLDSLFRVAEEVSDGDLLCYVNADILLTSELPQVLGRVRDTFEHFLVIGRRWNVEAARIQEYSPTEGEAALSDLARSFGSLEPVYGGGDLFAFRRGFWGTLPPFLMGRGRWDSGLILEARRMGAPVIDVTAAITAVHPIHGYRQPGRPRDVSRRADELDYNAKLLGGPESIFNALNATHIATRTGFRRNRPKHPLQLARLVATLPALYPLLRPMVPLIRWSAPIARRLLWAGARLRGYQSSWRRQPS